MLSDISENLPSVHGAKHSQPSDARKVQSPLSGKLRCSANSSTPRASASPAVETESHGAKVDIAGQLLGAMACMSAGVAASLAGAPSLGAALAYLPLGAAAWTLGRHAVTEEAQAAKQLQADTKADAHAADIFFKTTLELFSREERQILLNRVYPYMDRLDRATLLMNVHRALMSKPAFQSTSQVLQRLPVADWCRAAQHHQSTEAAALLAQQRTEIRSLQNEEWASALSTFLSNVTAHTPKFAAGPDTTLDDWLGGERHDPAKGQQLYEREIQLEHAAKSTNGLENWQTPQVATIAVQALQSLEERTANAKQAYNSASKASAGAKDGNTQGLRDQYHTLRDKLHTRSLTLKVQHATDPLEKQHRTQALVIAKETMARNASARKNEQAYLQQTVAEQFTPGVISTPPALNAPIPSQLGASTLMEGAAQLGTAIVAGAAAVQHPALATAMVVTMLASRSSAATAADSRPITILAPTQPPTPAIQSTAPLRISPATLALNNRTEASNQAILTLLGDQLTQYMGDLDTAQQTSLLNLATAKLKNEIAFAETVQKADADFEARHRSAFQTHFENRFGKELVASETFLVTRYRRGLDPEKPSKFDQIITKKVSLWDAAKNNFNWPTGTESFNNQNTKVVDSRGNALPAQITATRIIEQVRTLNLGAARGIAFEALNKQLAPQRTAAQSTQWQLDCLDFARLNPAEPVLPHLNAMNARQWTHFELALGSGAANQGVASKVSPPLFLFEHGDRAYSYFPGRPGGAIRSHFTRQQAFTDIKAAIVADAKSGKLAWLERSLSAPDQAKLQEFLRTEDLAPDPKQLNVVARFLHQTFGSEPGQRTDELFLVPAVHRPPLPTLGDATDMAKSNRLREDWNYGYRSTGEAVQAGLTSEAERALTEVLELFSLPLVPLGMNRVFQGVMLASMGYQLGSAGVELLKGNKDEAVQALADLLDLGVNGKLQGYAGVLNNRRVAGLIKAMQRPKHGINDKDAYLWWQAEEVSLYLEPVGPLPGTPPDCSGVYHVGTQTFIQLEHQGELRSAKVAYDKKIRAYRLSGGPTGNYSPPVRFVPSSQRHVIDVDLDIRRYSNTELLRQMLPTSLQQPPFSNSELAQVLSQTGSSRAELDAVWKGSKPAPVELVDALADFKLRQSIDQSAAAAREPAAVLSTAQERVILPALAKAVNRPLKVYTDKKMLLVSYLPSDAPVDARPIELIRIRSGEYRSAADSVASDTPNSDSLWRNVIREDARLIQAPGTEPSERAKAVRIAELKAQVADAIHADRSEIHRVHATEKTRDELSPADPARDYAPQSAAHLEASPAVKALKGLYPYLSLNAARILLQRHPMTAGTVAAARHQLPLDLRNSCDQANLTNRLNRALSSLREPSINHLTLDSESVLFTALTGFDNLNIKVEVHNNAGEVARYGDANAKDTIAINREAGGRYSARGNDGDSTPAQKDANPLASAVLLAMNDEQRKTIGLEVYDAGKLADKATDFYRSGWLRGIAANQLQPSAKLEVDEYRVKGLELAGLKADTRGVYTHANGKLYIQIKTHVYQVKLDHLYREAGQPPTLRIIRAGSPQSAKPGNDYNPASGYGLAIERAPEGHWRISKPGLLGGAPLRRTPQQIIQQVCNVNAASAQGLLNNFRFPEPSTSLHTEMTMALYLEQTLTLPSWVWNYQITPDLASPVIPPGNSGSAPGAPEIPAVNLDHILVSGDSPIDSPPRSVDSQHSSQSSPPSELAPVEDVVNPMINRYQASIQLPPNSHINRLGLVESIDIETVYRAIPDSAIQRYGDPMETGFAESRRFLGITKMLDGDVIIASETEAGARRFADAEFGKGYELFAIDTRGIPAVSLERNIEWNAQFLEEREGDAPGRIASLRAQGYLDSYAEDGRSFREVHVLNEFPIDRISRV